MLTEKQESITQCVELIDQAITILEIDVGQGRACAEALTNLQQAKGVLTGEDVDDDFDFDQLIGEAEDD